MAGGILECTQVMIRRPATTHRLFSLAIAALLATTCAVLFVSPALAGPGAKGKPGPKDKKTPL